MRFFLKLIPAFLNRFKALILVSVVLGLVSFFAFERIIPVLSSLKTTKIGITGRFTPDDLPNSITKFISRGLTQVLPDGTIVADLAGWESSEDGRVWKFTLKEGIQWQDGKKLVSSDINYEFSDVEINIESDNTIVFKLKDPFIPFPSVLAKPIFKKGLLGLGEWKVKKVKLNGRYVQELFLEKGTGEKILYKFYPTEESTKTAFKLGKVDKIDNILDPSPFNEWVTASTDRIVNTNQVATLFFNTQDKFLSDKTVRQALTYAIDKSKLGERAISPVSANSWAYNPQVKEYAFDVKRAKEILEDVPDDVIKGVNLKLVTTPLLLEKAEVISKNWNDIGIKSSVQVTSVVPTEFQVYLTILDLPDDPDQYPLWHSTQTQTNISKYSNPRIDKLLEDGRVTENTEERRKIYLDFQRFILEDVPAAFLYNPVYYTITRK